MLNSETKNKIKALRDTLVGKIPDPKGQIDQITNALIYKFMYDQDQKSCDLGGKPSFFVEDLAQYAWNKLFDSKLSNTDKAQLYREGIEKLSEAKHLPPLFQDIFKNAYLPFRADGTIALFLNGINGFSYDNSEELGNAFEYLLSDMSSQGNAGQFRTPRHIINFIVQVVSPQKNDSIFDPACGTAGFLIEAYKYIRKENQNLSSQEEINLSKNISGVDIDPTMAKLAKVNLYLHDFKTPKIDESDTLTNEKLWKKQKYDCILANPPFMTPKGGIQPHKHFSVQANRSEVLFVDYIAEHLKLQGKAGVIVPEGIIFQAATAYKKLRTFLVENWGLYAVVSLPSGVFNPYSGVKTSILFLDRSLKSDDILFCKVNNTGICLGATNNKIDENDLPQVLHILQDWKQKQYINDKNKHLAYIVPKTKIAENKEYNLTGDRYKENINYENAKYPMVELDKFCIFHKGKSSSTKTIAGQYPLVLTAKERKSSNHFDFDGNCVLVPLISSTGHGKADLKTIHYQTGKFAAADLLAVLLPDEQKCNFKFLYFMIDSQKDYIAKSRMSGSANVSMKIQDLLDVKIPLPPLEFQEQIVAEIEQWQKVIDGVKQVIENYKPSFAINPNWEMVELEDMFLEIKNGKNVKQFDKIGKYKVSRIKTIADGTVDLRKTKYTNDEVSEDNFLQEGDILFSHINSLEHLAKTGIFLKSQEKVIHGANLIKLKPNKEKILPKYAINILKSDNFINNAKRFAQKAVNQASINTNSIKKLKIPLPPLEVQEQIVAEIEAEQKAVEECKTLKAKMEQKITNKIAKVWE